MSLSPCTDSHLTFRPFGDADKTSLTEKYHSHIRATGHFILVKPYIRPTKVDGILIDDDTRLEDGHHSTVAQVIDVGPIAYMDEKFSGGMFWCEIGDWVIIPRVAGCRVSMGEEIFRLVPDDSIVAIVKDPVDWEIRINNTKF